jgi:hypothetical protein
MGRHDDQLTAAMADLRARAEQHGEPSLRDGVLHFGDAAIPRPDFPIVTGVEDQFGCTVSIFVVQGDGFVRATTNIHRDEVRALGTELDPTGPVIGPISGGESYRGPADILGVMHDTYYEPIVDGGGTVIGAFLVGYPHED